MGVDNNGMLVVGLEMNKIQLDRLPGFYDGDDEYESELMDSWLWRNRETTTPPKTMGMDIQVITVDYWPQPIVGVVVADSGSYSYKEVEDLGPKIQLATNWFWDVFGLDPKTYIMNHQW